MSLCIDAFLRGPANILYTIGAREKRIRVLRQSANGVDNLAVKPVRRRY